MSTILKIVIFILKLQDYRLSEIKGLEFML